MTTFVNNAIAWVCAECGLVSTERQSGNQCTDRAACEQRRTPAAVPPCPVWCCDRGHHLPEARDAIAATLTREHRTSHFEVVAIVQFETMDEAGRVLDQGPVVIEMPMSGDLLTAEQAGRVGRDLIAAARLVEAIAAEPGADLARLHEVARS